MKPILNFVFLEKTSIFRQLQYEEALLRADQRNWCLMNIGTDPAIVMGISGKVEQLVHLEKWRRSALPLIRRFSGGGTVFVDENTLFITLICQADDVEVQPFPRPIMEWTAQLYRPSFDAASLPFFLRENDYVCGDRKWGGNAQSIIKGRWLQHSSLLWDFNPQSMEILLHPPKVPTYRGARPHSDFLCSLCTMWEDKEVFLSGVKEQLSAHFNVVHQDQAFVEEIEKNPHRRTTQVLLL